MNHREEWLACLRATFEGLDRDRDGRISTAEIMRVLMDKLPEEEVGGNGCPGVAGCGAGGRGGGRGQSVKARTCCVLACTSGASAWDLPFWSPQLMAHPPTTAAN
jgi:hypothetical protein